MLRVVGRFALGRGRSRFYSTSKPFDLCVLGGGPAGYAAAMRALDFEKRVCIVEQNSLGGAGVQNGALSSKALWQLSQEFNSLRRYVRTPLTPEWDVISSQVKVASELKVAQLATQLHNLQQDGLLTFVQGRGKFTSPTQLSVTTLRGEKAIDANNFIVATGSRPRGRPDLPFDGHTVLSSDQILNLDEFPESIAIVGAGVIGCEFATIFANFGMSERVVLVNPKRDRILPQEDADMSALIENNLKGKGVEILNGGDLVGMEYSENGVTLTMDNDGKTTTTEVQKVLLSIGRIPNTKGIGLDEAGVEVDANGGITNESTKCGETIFAVGDVTLDVGLVNVGEMEGRSAVERLFSDHPPSVVSYKDIPSIMFLDPEVACVGLNEQDAQKLEIPHVCAKYHFNLVNRAISSGHTSGYIKLIVSDDEERRILGMRAAGMDASSIIGYASMMMKADHTLQSLVDTIQPHPSISEAVLECARVLLGHSVMKPTYSDEVHVTRFVPRGQTKEAFTKVSVPTYI